MALFMFYSESIGLSLTLGRNIYNNGLAIRYKNNTITQLGLLLLSFGVGPRMIWLVNHGSWLKNMAQCPQFATIWLYTVIQLKLSFALLSLVLIGGWSWWTGMKLL
ncbi:hypothetical protein JVT61DRAFT_13096 [Boletus reticuloceps]|uniref:DUF7719 domain-containing protein n=1 Tax=Boletus reticuloceps TaxID=495285 RepID=A0A8I2YYG3_9AGAM|nr:hypothetical protein JVT61DRAFT_13096 [Boletus reticuloceps]